MKIKSFFPWDSLISVITVIMNVIFLFCVLDAFRTEVMLFEIISLCFITIPVLFLPLRLIVTNENVIIRRLYGRVKIQMSDIKSCWMIEDSDVFFNSGVRRFGSGGMYGILGHFKHDKLGKLRCFITHREQCFVIKKKDNSYFVISSPKRKEIVELINKNKA
ncbi:MAG: hypothetical protein IJZ06_09070 [Bacteroidales bacterium]|nr:hypothetical protein [Bacteroidales bacterium]